jgi:hypothetical protein
MTAPGIAERNNAAETGSKKGKTRRIAGGQEIAGPLQAG